MVYLNFEDWYKAGCKVPITETGREVTSTEKAKLKKYYDWRTIPTVVNPLQIVLLYDTLSQGGAFAKAGGVVKSIVEDIRTYGALKTDWEIPAPDKIESFIRGALGPVASGIYDTAEGINWLTGGPYRKYVIPVALFSAVAVTLIYALRR